MHRTSVTSIVVPDGGVPEHELFALLGLSSREVYPLLGDELLSPRDYRYPSRPRYSCHYFTPAGVRAIAAHFGLDVELTAPGQRRAEPPLMWWQKD